MIELIQNNINAIADACKKHHVKKLFVFGSAARNNDFTSKSDIDVLVNFETLPLETNEQVFYVVENRDKLQEQLKNIFNREIDLIEEEKISNKYLRYFINKEKKLLYEVS
ncbi:MAG TPA: nucleotidyltransferase domain-containing protein [Parafilimonas sp.]|nr:nucleotidyltransferase domain-containing protein [Parafilimonas sp.]